jgi:hypothetical protein
MCRAEVSPEAELAVALLLGALLEAIAERAGCDPAEVLIGPVDFGGEHG